MVINNNNMETYLFLFLALLVLMFFSLGVKWCFIWHGDIFKTHILGCPSVMVSTPELTKDVLVNRAHLFKPTYPLTKETLIGPKALFFHQGDYHAKLKKLVQASFVPNVLKASVCDIERIVRGILPSLENKTINTLKEMKRFAFDVAMLSVFGRTYDVEIEGIKELYHIMEGGYNSMPFKLPGTPFKKAVKARELLNGTMRRVIDKRREGNGYGAGLLGKLLESQDMSKMLSDSQVADNVIGVIFAAHDTTASVLTWILKYLHDSAEVLNAVTVEQEKIRRRLIEDDRDLSWEDFKNMQLTNQVIQETLRTSSIISFTFREAVEDVELEGFLIPKGWKVLPLFRAIHHSEEIYPEHEKFNPSRFEAQPRPNTYLPFGTGGHSCPGSELAKLEMLVLLHHLTNDYRWEVVGEKEGIQYMPFPVPIGGLPLKITHKEEQTN
ncbi:hypothetical protein GIB67_040536 [Kingdonia uniflora]|uniref:Cytochrome P450 n=1 Tax=Kingdonia uniflora TaxID=39325 RepID=A0A7J7L5I7_9MAGN|nr:hypothetical protein GIB67_040536 [Kingdonia uniflora]